MPYILPTLPAETAHSGILPHSFTFIHLQSFYLGRARTSFPTKSRGKCAPRRNGKHFSWNISTIPALTSSSSILAFLWGQLRGLNLMLGWCYLLYSFRVNLVLLDFKHHRLEMDLLLISGPIIFFANRRSLILSQLRFWCEEDHWNCFPISWVPVLYLITCPARGANLNSTVIATK